MSEAALSASHEPLTPSTVSPSPITQFERWLAEAALVPGLNPHDFCLSTSTLDGELSARVVTLKHVDARGFAFHTHYKSRKAQELTENPRAALTFFWAQYSRSVRVLGSAERVSSQESDEYFLGRPRGGLLAAWASEQSTVVKEGEVKEKAKEFSKIYAGKDVPRPDNWGGFRIVPRQVEFWQGSMADRLHDRVRYTLSEEGSWVIERLSP